MQIEIAYVGWQLETPAWKPIKLCSLICRLFLLVSLAVIGVRPAYAAQAGSDGMITVQYEASEDDFPNPERGFHKNTDLFLQNDLRWIHTEGFSLVRAYVRLDKFRDQPLSQDFLNGLRKGFANVRNAGIKVLPIFAYNFPSDEDIKAGRLKESPDAPLPLVLRHLRQLKPVLRENEDVIAALELGFVGAWGEWHSSKNGLDTPENKAKIHKAILAALPKSRMMQLRYPADLMAIYPTPLDKKDAFSGSDQARTGFANMCFLANESDAGTYFPLDTREQKQQYLEQMTQYVIVGGETCQISPEHNRIDTATAMAEFQRFHFSYINRDFYSPTMEQWKTAGLLDMIARRLGYRFRLKEATLPTHIRPGDSFVLKLSLYNDGWASPYNPRPVEFILRSKATGQLLRFPMRTNPRRWFASPEPYKVTATINIPQDAQEDKYEALLNFPDPMPSLAERPEYAIRLANRDVWEASTGFNRLLAEISVSRSDQTNDPIK